MKTLYTALLVAGLAAGPVSYTHLFQYRLAGQLFSGRHRKSEPSRCLRRSRFHICDYGSR